MACYAVKRDDETNDALQKRFKRQMQETGLLKLLRARGVFKKKPNRRTVRMKAIDREAKRTKNRKQQFYSNM